jgi:hypothetical protein
VGLADPVEAEDEEHGPRERAAAPQHRVLPPPDEPEPAPLLRALHEERAHPAHEVVGDEHEHPGDEAERDEHDGGQRQARRLRRRERAAAHGPVRVPPRVRRVFGVQLLLILPRGAGAGDEERRPHGGGVRDQRRTGDSGGCGVDDGHCWSRARAAESSAGLWIGERVFFTGSCRGAMVGAWIGERRRLNGSIHR